MGCSLGIGSYPHCFKRSVGTICDIKFCMSVTPPYHIVPSEDTACACPIQVAGSELNFTTIILCAHKSCHGQSTELYNRSKQARQT